MIPNYWEEVIIDYKASIGFKRGVERMGVILNQFEYQITLAHFKVRYPKLDLKDSFTNYLEDQNVPMVIKESFDISLYPLPYPDA